MEKIFELKDKDFISGVSLQERLPIGGIFRSYYGDPFKYAGLAYPTISPIEISVGESVKSFVHWANSGVGYIYGQSDTHLYQFLTDSPYTKTDVSSEIYQHLSFGTASSSFGPSIKWRNKYIYDVLTTSGNGNICANSFPVTSANDVLLLDANDSSLQDYRPKCVGADLNLYVGGVGGVYKLTNEAGTSGNSSSQAYQVEAGMVVRDILNDGTYLIILADNNTIPISTRQPGNYRCRVYFWDMAKTTADVIWDISDSYLIGGAFLNNAIYVFGYNGIHVCNVATPPKLVKSFLETGALMTFRPANPSNIFVNNDMIFWANGAETGGQIVGYGTIVPGGTKIHFNPYVSFTSANNHLCLSGAGSKLFASSNVPKVYIHNDTDNGTVSDVSFTTVPKTLDKPYQFAYAKIVLSRKLASDEDITFSMTSGNSSNAIVSQTIKTYAQIGSKQEVLFHPNPNAGDDQFFTSFYIAVSSPVPIERVSVYGNPQDDNSQKS